MTHEQVRRTPLNTDLTPQDPDSIMQSELPQIPDDQLDVPNALVVGRFAGPTEKVKSLLLGNPNGKTLWKRVEQTQFVRVQGQDGTVHMARYNPDIHGIWDDIPPIEGMTPAAFVAELEGFGDEQTPQNQQFENEQKKKGGARRKHWPVNRHPKPKNLQ